MADDRRAFQVIVPHGTGAFPPGQFPIAVPVGRIVSIDWRVPLGAQSQLGWALGMGGVAIIPPFGQRFIVAAGESGTFQGGGLPDSGAWQLLAFNFGQFDHSVFLVFHLEFPERQAAPRVLWTPSALSEAPDLSRAGPPLPPRGLPFLER